MSHGFVTVERMGVVFFLIAVAWGLAVVWHDATSQRIPNYLTMPGVLVTWALCATSPLVGVEWWQPWQFAPGMIFGGVAWWLFIVVMGAVGGRHLRAGGGDAKLGASLGAVALASGLGILGWLAAVGLSGVLGCATAMLVDRDRGVPQGPAMVITTGMVALCGFVRGSL